MFPFLKDFEGFFSWINEILYKILFIFSRFLTKISPTIFVRTNFNCKSIVIADLAAANFALGAEGRREVKEPEPGFDSRRGRGGEATLVVRRVQIQKKRHSPFG